MVITRLRRMLHHGAISGRDWVSDGMDVSAEESMAPPLTVLIMIGWRNEESQLKGWTNERVELMMSCKG